MNFVRNFFSSIVGSLLVFVIGSLIILFSITNVVFDQKFILGTLEKNDTYNKIATEVVPKFLVFATTQRYQPEKTDQSLAEGLSEKVDKTAFSSLKPDLEAIFKNSYLFLIGQKESFEVRIELKNYLPKLSQNLGQALTSLQQEGKFQDVNPDDIGVNAEGANEASLLITEDKIEVTGLNEVENQTKEKNPEESPLKKGREIIQKTRETQGVLVVGALLLTILLFLTRLPHFLSGLKWIASTLISSAFLPLVAGFLLFLFKPVTLVSRFLKGQEVAASFSTGVDLFEKNIGEITNKIFYNIMIFSATLLVVGILLYILVFVLSKKFQAKNA